MDPLKRLVAFTVPLYITWAYQLMPVPVRRLWGMRGAGSSHIVIGTAACGEVTSLWPVFFRCCSGVIYLPGYLAGSFLRITGLARLLRLT